MDCYATLQSPINGPSDVKNTRNSIVKSGRTTQHHLFLLNRKQPINRTSILTISRRSPYIFSVFWFRFFFFFSSARDDRANHAMKRKGQQNFHNLPGSRLEWGTAPSSRVIVTKATRGELSKYTGKPKQNSAGYIQLEDSRTASSERWRLVQSSVTNFLRVCNLCDPFCPLLHSVWMQSCLSRLRLHFLS